MTTELIPADFFTGLPSTEFADETFEEVATSTDFLQRLQLISKGKYVDTKQAQGGDYAIIIDSDTCKVIGDTIDILVLERRHKALDMSDTAQVITSYDPETDLFADIKARSAEKDSGCQYGVTFFITERSTRKPFEFFFGTKSLRRALSDMYAYMSLSPAQIKARKLPEGTDPHGPMPLTLKSKNVRSRDGKFSWFVPVFQDCSTPFTIDQLPAAEKLNEEIIKFSSSDKGAKAVTQPEGTKKRAR